MGLSRARGLLLSALAFLFPLLVAAPAAAQQGELAGTVRSADGAALESVRVEVVDADGGSTAAVTTGTSGAFRVEELPAGSYTVVFELPGWETVRRRGVDVRTGEATTLSVTMRARAFTLNPLTVTAARQEQKLLDAPASVEVIDQEEVGSQPALSYIDFLEGKTGVDVIRSGLQQGYVVARGFNNVFSGSLLTLTDHRIARVPSLRANIPHLDPTTSLDIARMELVLGPGSALYGPNAANGVLHKITRSPIDDPGSVISVSGGLREQAAVQGFDASDEGSFFAEGRLAHRFSDRFGVKVAGEYFTGEDFRFRDPAEAANDTVSDACLAAFSLQNPACLVFAPAADQLPDRERLERIARRDFQLERWTMNAEAEWRPGDDTQAFFTYGRTQATSSIDLTGIGAAAIQDWAYQFAQARLNKGEFFAQAFVNWSSSGDTYILRTGQPIDDESYIAVGQLQHATDLSPSQRFVYGVDYIHTNPVTNRSINGVHEDDDAIDEFGGYLQSETQLSERWELTLAARADYHSVLDEVILSPRGALVYKPGEQHSLRATFNRAFATPDNNNLFLDILAQRIPLGGSGFSYGLNAQGTSDRGFTFAAGPGGRPMMKSPFTPPGLGGPGQFLPTRTPTLWQLAVGVVAARDPSAGALLAGLPVPGDGEVATLLRGLDTGTGGFGEPIPFSSVRDVPAIQEEITNTFEVGYKGLIGGRLLLSLDGYYTKVQDFIGPLSLETPNAFLDGQDVAAYLVSQGVPQTTAQSLAETMASLPLGVVTPREVAAPGPNLLLTYRNVGDVDLWGADLSATYRVGGGWELGATTSWVSDDVFSTDLDQRVELNAPSFKARASVGYRSDESPLGGEVSWRFVNGFPAASGVFVGGVEDYDVMDLNLSWDLPRFPGATLQLDVQNVLDEDYSTFPGAPELGRFTMARLKYAF